MPRSRARLNKRETKTQNKHEFIEDKLIQHGQALEHLIRLAEKNEELTNKLIDNISRAMQQPELPDRVEVLLPSRRAFQTFISETTTEDNPFVAVGKALPKFGGLAKKLFLTNFVNESAPIPIVETRAINSNTTEIREMLID